MDIAIRAILIFLMISLTSIIFYKSKLEKSRIKLGLLSLAITYWIISFEMLRMSMEVSEVTFWAKSIFVAAPSALISMYALSREFRESKYWGKKVHSRILYGFFLIIIISIIFTDWIITIGDPKAIKIADKAPIGKYYIFCIAFYLYLTIHYFNNLFLSFKRNPKQRIKVVYIGLSTILTLMVTLITTGVLPLFKIYDFVWLGPYSTTVFIATLTNSVLRYRLFDIDLLIRRLVVLIALSIIAIVANELTFFVLDINTGVVTKSQLVYIVTVNLLLIILFYLNYNNLEIITKQIFTKKKEDYISSIVSEIKGLNKFTKVDELIEATNMLFIKNMEVTGTAIYLIDNDNSGNYIKKTFGIYDHGFPDKLDGNNAIVRYFEKNNKILDKEELQHEYNFMRMENDEKLKVKDVIKLLDNQYNSSIIIPLVTKREVIGIAFLQSKKSGYQYTNAELLLLKTLALNLATFLDNILLHEKTVKNEKMALIGTMASIFAHEVRNPLTSVSAYLGMLPNKLDNPSFLEKFFAIVPGEINRVAKLTTDLLDFAKSNESNLKTVDVKLLIDRVLELVKNESNNKRLEIKVNTSEDSTVIADENQLYQVLLNMIINAIHASGEGKKIKINVSNSNSHTEIEIEDEGEGIAEGNLKKIFEPFYSTKIYGTGLGLATCKRIIESHGGVILVESEKGKGSKFIIVIPRKSVQNSTNQSNVNMIG